MSRPRSASASAEPRPRRRPGLGDQRAGALAGRIERDIGMGNLAPGSWLKQIDLEARYRATRMQVRQALDRLAQKGLVHHRARRGYQVADFDPERLAQVMEIRAVLESAAAALVIDRLDEASLEAMLDAARRYRAAVDEGTIEELERTNLEYHRIMLAPCPNRELVALLFDLRGRVPVAVTRRRNTEAVLRRGAEHHFEIVDLIRARDLPALRRRMRAHNLSPTAPIEETES